MGLLSPEVTTRKLIPALSIGACCLLDAESAVAFVAGAILLAVTPAY
jgi:hypothetical protein